MTTRATYIAGAAAFALGAFWLLNRDQPGSLLQQLAATAKRWVTRGTRLTRTSLDENGDVDADPMDLVANAASVAGVTVTLNEYALARMLGSEEANADPNTKVAIAWVALNEAERRGVSIANLLLRDNGPGNGRFGEQRGRYASTARDPYEVDLQIAQSIISGQVGDITGGAIHFYRPDLQDRLYDMGKVSKTAAEIDESWGGGGFTIDTVDEGITFYRAA